MALGIEAQEIAASESHPIIGWLLTDARKLADPAEFVEAFALRPRQSGVDVARITVGVPILHPQLFSFSCLWQLGKGVGAAPSGGCAERHQHQATDLRPGKLG